MQYTQPISFSPPTLLSNPSLVSASVTGANAGITASLPAASGKFTYIEGFDILAGGATAAAAVIATVTGLTTPLNYTVVAVAGVGTQVKFSMLFPTPIPGSAVNTAVALTVPAFGAGNTGITATAFGFQA